LRAMAERVLRRRDELAGVFKSAHGVRNTAATADAEAGWSNAELDARFGPEGQGASASESQCNHRPNNRVVGRAGIELGVSCRFQNYPYVVDSLKY
jgi:hypothetical protein